MRFWMTVLVVLMASLLTIDGASARDECSPENCQQCLSPEPASYGDYLSSNSCFAGKLEKNLTTEQMVNLKKYLERQTTLEQLNAANKSLGDLGQIIAPQQ